MTDLVLTPAAWPLHESPPHLLKDAASDSAIPSVLALHCSGGNPRQWSELASRLPDQTCLHCPSYQTVQSAGVAANPQAFRLSDEAKPMLEWVAQQPGPIHLVGHSYGGALALFVALAMPEKVGTMTLHEPCMFNLMQIDGSAYDVEYAEIWQTAAFINRHIQRGRPDVAMQHFVDYWNGPGSWASMPTKAQAKLIEWSSKAPMDFAALFAERPCALALQTLAIPTTVVVGEYAPPPTRSVADALRKHLPLCSRKTLAGAGHMGPVSHPGEFADLAIRAMGFGKTASTNVASSLMWAA
ncbi:MAG: alpha/beta fold hydrolase [Burkholderiaceae bacterium]